MRISKICSIALLLFSGLPHFVVAQSRQKLEELAHTVVAAQALSESIQPTGDGGADTLVGLIPFAIRQDNTVSVWQATILSSRGRLYLLGSVRDTAVYLLGGFSAPNLMQFYNETHHSGMNESKDLLCEARGLALLADPNGGWEVTFPFSEKSSDSVESSIRSALVSSGGPVLPDTVWVVDPSRVVARVTVLSHAGYHGSGGWTPLHYIFVFSQTGKLVGWNKTEGPELTFTLPSSTQMSTDPLRFACEKFKI